MTLKPPHLKPPYYAGNKYIIVSSSMFCTSNTFALFSCRKSAKYSKDIQHRKTKQQTDNITPVIMTSKPCLQNHTAT